MLFSMMPSVWLLGVPLAPVVADAGVVTMAQVPAWLGLMATVTIQIVVVTAWALNLKGDLRVLRADMGTVRDLAVATAARVEAHLSGDHAPHAAMLFTAREAEEARRTADAEHKALRAEMATLRR